MARVISRIFIRRLAGGRKGRRGKMVARRLGSNRHHPVAWKGGKP